MALPVIPWHRGAGADNAAAGCVDAILRQTTQPLFVLLATTRGGKAGCQGTNSFQLLFCPGIGGGGGAGRQGCRKERQSNMGYKPIDLY